MNEPADNHVSAPPASPPAREYSELGERVASVLNAAEQAAEQIRSEARREADAVRRDAEAQAQTYAEERRREADSESERRMASALADAEAIRDTAQAAARRIAEEGQRRLGELRDEARALERRFESAIDDLRDLVAQLEDVVLGSGGSSYGAEDANGQPEAAERPAEPELTDALAPRYGDESDELRDDALEGEEAPEPGRSPYA